MTPLHIPHRHVVRHGVSEDVAHRVVLGDIPTALADDDRELDLPVELLGMRTRPPDGRVPPAGRGIGASRWMGEAFAPSRARVAASRRRAFSGSPPAITVSMSCGASGTRS